jgi:hypothetical protein
MPESIDRRINALAHRQRGYVQRAQLLALGLGPEAIRYRVRIGRLIPVYAGVYAVGHVPALPQDRAYGALIACGDGAVLGHGTAAVVWGIYRRWEEPFEVTARTARRRDGIIIHRAALTPADVTHQVGLAVTSPARTLLDMSPRLSDMQLRRAVNSLRLDHYLVLEDLADVTRRFPRHPGARRLTQFADSRRGATRSELEDKFVDLCVRHGLPEPLLNVPLVPGREADAFFAVERLIVEIDGYGVHSGRVSFEDDRDKDAEMLAVGLPTVRVTEERIDNDPAREAARLHRILERLRRAA